MVVATMVLIIGSSELLVIYSLITKLLGLYSIFHLIFSCYSLFPRMAWSHKVVYFSVE